MSVSDRLLTAARSFLAVSHGQETLPMPQGMRTPKSNSPQSMVTGDGATKKHQPLVALGFSLFFSGVVHT